MGDGQTRQFVFEFSAFSSFQFTSVSFQFSSVMVINICEDYENRGEDYIFSAKITFSGADDVFSVYGPVFDPV